MSENNGKIDRRLFFKGSVAGLTGLATLGYSQKAYAARGSAMRGAGEFGGYSPDSKTERGAMFPKHIPNSFYKTIPNRDGYVGTTKVLEKTERIDGRETGFSQAYLTFSNRDFEGGVVDSQGKRQTTKEWGETYREVAEIAPDIQQGLDWRFGNAAVMASDQFHVNFGPDQWEPIAVHPSPVELPAEEMTEIIKNMGKWFGCHLVGICETKDMDPYFYSYGRQFGSLRGGAYQEGRVVIDEGRKIDLPYKHKYMIVMGSLYKDIAGVKTQVGPMNNATVATECGDHDIYPLQMESFIRGLGWDAHGHNICGTEDIMQVPFAIKAGLGEHGRSGLLVTPWGAHLRLGAVSTNLPLISDQPIDFGLQEFCRTCKKCAEVCPVGAICEEDDPYEVKGGFKEPKSKGFLGWDRDPYICMKQRATQGCAACAAVCPYTKPNNVFHNVTRALLSKNDGVLNNMFLTLDDLFYGKLPKPYEMGHFNTPWKV